MGHSVLPHFEHHRQELLRTRRRFGGLLLLLMVAGSVTLGLHYRASHAASLVTVSGRVYNASSGAGLPNVTVQLCGSNPNLVTNASGYWSFSLGVDYGYCVRYVSGAPGGLRGPTAPNNNPEEASSTTYEWQAAGMNCYHNTTDPACGPSGSPLQVWDRAVDTGNDLAFTNPPATPTPTPTPIPTPVPHTPTPKPPTPVPTPKPATPTPKSTTPTQPGAPAVTTAPVAPADTTPPTTPDGFEALVDGNNALVSLAWHAASDSGGLKGYHVERSLDQATWTIVVDNQSDTSYRDESVGFGVTYYYRLTAVDLAGNVSPPALVNVATPAFQANTADTGTAYTSDDKLATATLPAGALTDQANCSVTTDTRLKGTQTQPLVAGPYVLVCKDASGQVLSDLQKPVVWALNLKTKLKNYTNPQAIMQGSDGKAAAITGATFDTKSQIFQFTSAQLTPVAVLASYKQGWPVTLIVVLAIIVLLVAGAAIFLLRRRQVQNYDDYMRSKYYNF